MKYRVTNVGASPLTLYARRSGGFDKIHLAKRGDTYDADLSERAAKLLGKYGAAHFEKIEQPSDHVPPDPASVGDDRQISTDNPSIAPPESSEAAANSKGEL